jgi:hypothetical protein
LEGPAKRRVGRGGRSYPGDPAAQRKRIVDEAGRQPTASNAAIARAVTDDAEVQRAVADIVDVLLP